MIPALIGAGVAAGSAIYNAFNSNRNYQNQLNLQRYNEALQQQIFAREDTAYQRTVKDMRAAGLSPLAMNGTNGAGEVIAQNAPQRENPDFSTTVSSLFSVADMMNEFKSRQLQNENMKLQNEYLKSSMQARLDQSSYSAESTRLANIMAQYLNSDRKRQEEFNKFFNINDGMSEKERAAAFALKAVGKDYKAVSSYADNFSTIFDKSVGRVNGFLGTINSISDKVDDVVNAASEQASQWASKTVDNLKKMTASDVVKDVKSVLSSITGIGKKKKKTYKGSRLNRNSKISEKRNKK